MHHRNVRISDIIDSSRISLYQACVLALCFLIVLLDGFDTAAIGYIAPELQREWGIERAQLWPALSAGLVGMLIGNLCLGPVADRYGRRIVLLVCIFIFAVGTLASALSDSLLTLSVLRLLTGIGLGGVPPNCITLGSEYSPARHRMLLVALSYGGFTLGLAMGGEVAARIIPAFGWQGVLVIGGLAPLLLLPVLYRVLPESAHYMAGKPGHAIALRKVMEKISGHREWDDAVFVGDERPSRDDASPARQLFANGYALRTLLLWLTFFCCLSVFYLLTSWLPAFLRDYGYDVAQGSRIAAMIPLGGGIGGVIMAILMDRVGPFRVLPALCAIAALTLAMVGFQLGEDRDTWLLLSVFVLGFSLTGALNNLSIVSATLYPTSARATGVSWALGAGRIGSILGATIGGWLALMAESPARFFIWLAIPLVMAAFALVAMRRSGAPSPIPAMDATR